MSMRNLLSRGLVAAVLGMAALSAGAAEQPGFYVGAGAGQAMIDDGALDDEDTAFSAFAGYQVNPYFGLEAGYADLGKTEPLGSPGPELETDASKQVALGTLPF